MQPISSRFLKSTITLYAKTGEDSYGRETYGTGQEIKRVYVEIPRRSALSDLGERKADTLFIVHDVMKSTPATYTKGDKVAYAGQEFYVREAQLLPNPETPHHWEVRLT